MNDFPIWGGAYDAVLEKALRGQYDESKHLRYPKGDKRGGQFAPKRGAATSTQTVTERDADLEDRAPVAPTKGIKRFPKNVFDSSEYAEAMMTLSAQEKKAYNKLFEGYFAALGSTADDSVPLEYLISRKFGGKIWNYGGIVSPKDGENALRDIEVDFSVGMSVVSKQYRVTQKWLEQKYGKDGYVTLYRGVNGGENANVKNGKMRVELDALSSWTTNKGAARNFANGYQNGGKLLTMRVPIRDIFVADFTSKILADNGESEFSVLGRGREVWIPAQDVKYEDPFA